MGPDSKTTQKSLQDVSWATEAVVHSGDVQSVGHVHCESEHQHANSV